MGLFNYTQTDVTNTVSNAIDSFDKTVNQVSKLMSFNLGQNGDFSTLWNLTANVSTAISVVSVCMAVIYTYLAITKEGISLKGDFKRFITILLRLVIAKGLIDSATNFMFWVYSFGATITTIVNNKITGGDTSLKSMLDANQLAKGLGLGSNPSGFDCFVAVQYAKILGFFLWGLGIALVIIAVARILKLYVMMMFSSIAFAKLPIEGYNGIKEYLSSFLALSIQGAIIVGAIGLYKCCVASATVISSKYTDSMFGSFGLIVIFSISLVIIIAQSESIAKKIV